MEKYTKIRKLGSGGEGSVWLVKNNLSGLCPVALKYVQDGEAGLSKTHLAKEFHILSTLSHPALARVFDFGWEKGKGLEGRKAFYFTREYIDGKPLAAAGPRDPRSVLPKFVEILRALKPLHRSNIVHGDLKPSNIIITPEGKLRLIDFSMSGGARDPSRRPGGTLLYMAPEIIRQQAHDTRCDLYSAGIILLELLTGSHPLGKMASDPNAIVKAHLSGGIVIPASVPGWTKNEAAAVLELAGALLSPDPGKRPASAEEIEASIKGWDMTPLDDDPYGRRTPIVTTKARKVEKEGIIRAVGRFRAVKAGSAAVTISGPPGSGKSSMLREIKWHMQMEGLPVIELGGPDMRDEKTALSSMAMQLDWLASAALTEKEAKAAAGPRDKAGSADADAVMSRVQAWPGKAALFFLVDDIERSPGAFINFLGKLLAARSGPQLIIIATMDASSDTLFSSLPFDQRVDASLPPAGEQEIRYMLGMVAGRADPATVSWVKEVSGGNFAAASQAIEHVASAGPALEGPALKAWAPSRWLGGRWMEKFDALGREEKALVLAVALHYEPVSLRDAARIAGMGGVEEASEHVNADFLVSGRTGRLEISSGLLKDALRRLAGAEERKAVHKKWANHLESLPGRASQRLLHLIEAGEAAGVAGAVLLEAGGKKAAGRAAEALMLLESLLATIPDGSGRAVEPRLLLAEILIEAGRIEEALERLDNLETGDSVEHGLKKELLAGACMIASGDTAAGIGALERVADSPDGPASLRLEAIVALSDALLRKGDYDAALERIAAGMQVEDGDSGQSRVSLLCTEGAVHLYRHRKKKALAAFNRADELAAGRKENIHAIKVLGYRAMAQQMWGNLEEAGDLTRKAIVLCEKHGYLGRLAQNYLNLATILHRQGNFEECINYCLSAIDFATRSGQKATCASARINYCMLLGFLGMLQQAGLEIKRALGDTAGLGQKILEARAQAAAGEIAARKGETDEAERRFRTADSIFEQTGNRWEEAEVKLEIVDILMPSVLSGPSPLREAEIEELLDCAQEIALAAEGTLLSARYHIARARQLWLRGDRDESRGHIEEAIEICRDQKDEFDDFSWRIDVLMAQMSFCRKDYDNAMRHVEKAAAHIESLEEKLPGRLGVSFRGVHERRKAFELLETVSMARTPGRPLADSMKKLITRLMRINRKLAAERDLGALIELILDSSIEVTGAERGFLLMPDEAGSPAVTVARDFDSLRVPKEHIEFSKSIARQVLEGGESVYTISATADERFSSARSVHELGLQSIICVPIRSAGSVTGAIYLENHSSKALLIPPEEKDLLSAFSDQAAVAMENARLFLENERRIEQVETLSREKERLLEKRTKALRETRMQLKTARELFSRDTTFRGMVGASAGMGKIFETIKRLDESDVPVVIAGESGTGKELVARAIHLGSDRKRKAFIPVNCGALPPELLESELFGHVKGAFTGAAAGRKGLFSTASGGTLLLDEIPAMPLKMQVDLLRVLQEGKVRPIGSDREEKVNARILAATQVPLERLVKRGEFREDLYYRLNVVTIMLPPLRDRKDDIPLLVDHFLTAFSAKMKTPKKVISRKAMKFLLEYPWYGNIRELENALQGAWVLEEGKLLDTANFDFLLEKEKTASREATAGEGPGPALAAGEEKEKKKIIEILKKYQWNKSKAAEILAIPRRTFYRKLKKYGLV
ncbi:MAG: sigma 54-interacting transcriptional regulator [Pseudomonadota bacterium]